MRKIVVFFSMNLCITAAFAQSHNIVLTNIITGLTHPLYVTHAGDERLFVVEKTGLIKVFQPGASSGSVFLDITALTKYTGTTNSEQGLLGMAFHPNFKNNGYFYVNYTRKAPVNDGATVIARYKVSATDSNVADASSAHIILIVSQPYANHNGGCLQFGPDSYLYIGMGDGGSANDPQNYAQNLQSLLGKMLRINVDTVVAYSIPPTNPFYGSSSAAGEIWAYGLRNPWRFSFDRITHDMWIADVGQDAREEINFQPAHSSGGENYGWKCYEGTNHVTTNCAVAPTGTVMPVFEYFHNNAGGYSVTGGYVYRSAKHKNLWGAYFFADAVSQHLWITRYDGTHFTTTKVMNGTAGSSNVSFGEDVYGDLYLVKHASGVVQKIADTHAPQPHAVLLNNQSSYTDCEGSLIRLEALYHPDLAYQWRHNGQDIPGGQSHIFYAAESGNYSVYVTDPTLPNAYPDSSLEIAITIIPGSIQAFTQHNYTADINDVPFQLDVSIPGGSFSGTGVDTNGMFTPALAGIGTHQIIYTLMNNGCPQRDTAYIEVSQTVTASNIDIKRQVSIFPSPADAYFHIFSTETIESLSVIETTGREIYKNKPHSNTTTLSTAQMAGGVYLVKVCTPAGTAIKKIIIK